jgi:ribose transport system permease protein
MVQAAEATAHGVQPAVIQEFVDSAISSGAQKGAAGQRGRRPLDGRSSQIGVLAAFVVLIIVFSAAKPSSFPTWENVAYIANSSVTYVIFGVLATLVLILGEFDLAFPYIADFSTVLVGVLVTTGGFFGGAAGSVLAVIIALALGGIAGAVSGISISGGRLPSFVVTLAVGSVAGGLQLLVQGHIPEDAVQISVLSVPSGLRDAANTDLFGTHLVSGLLIAVVVAVIALLVIRFTVLGRRSQAIGGNAVAAYLASVPVARVRVIVFVVAGVLAALTGVVALGTTGYYYGESTPYLLQVYTAAFLGRAVWKEHNFTISGTILAIIFLQTLSNGLSLMNQPTWIVSVISGIVLLGAISITLRRKK